MASEIKIKKANVNDVNTIVSLVRDLLQGFNKVSGASFNIENSYLEEVCGNLISSKNYAAFIAYKSELPVGILTISEAFAIYNGGAFGIITELFVSSDCRSSGIGKLLLETVKDFARLKNWKKIEVGAPGGKEWTRTWSFYEKNGYKKGGPKLRIDL